MKTTLVTTTINIPVGLLDYAENARAHGRRNLDFIVIGDRKSPAETAAFCAGVSRRYPCAFYDLAAQHEYLERFPALSAHLRLDSIQRRNVGMLMAWENGADTVVTIDDDNFVTTCDFFGLHSRAGSLCEMTAYASPSGWFNVCSVLEAGAGVTFYHRGYPREQRWNETEIRSRRTVRRVAVNAGLWLDNPDIDALTRMERQPVVTGFKEPWMGTFCLEAGTWSPFNSQNTSLMRDVLPAYFLSPYIGRYDDIWAGYVVDRIAEHFGDAISFGEPLVRQERNPHNLWRDLDSERNGMILTGGLCEALRAVPLRGATYHECFGEIAAALPLTWTPQAEWTESQREWRSRFLEGIAIWHGVFEQLGASARRPAAIAAEAPLRNPVFAPAATPAGIGREV